MQQHHQHQHQHRIRAPPLQAVAHWLSSALLHACVLPSCRLGPPTDLHPGGWLPWLHHAWDTVSLRAQYGAAAANVPGPAMPEGTLFQLLMRFAQLGCSRSRASGGGGGGVGGGGGGGAVHSGALLYVASTAVHCCMWPEGSEGATRLCSAVQNGHLAIHRTHGPGARCYKHLG